MFTTTNLNVEVLEDRCTPAANISLSALLVHPAEPAMVAHFTPTPELLHPVCRPLLADAPAVVVEPAGRSYTYGFSQETAPSDNDDAVLDDAALNWTTVKQNVPEMVQPNEVSRDADDVGTPKTPAVAEHVVTSDVVEYAGDDIDAE